MFLVKHENMFQLFTICFVEKEKGVLHVGKILNSALLIIKGKCFFPYFVFFCAKVLCRLSSKRKNFTFVDIKKSNALFEYCYFENEKFSTEFLIDKFFTKKFYKIRNFSNC